MAGVKVRIETFGRFNLQVNGEDLEQFANGLSKPWQMFVLLAVQRGHYLGDAELIDCIWKDTELKEAKNNLKNAVLRLRKDLAGIATFQSDPIIRYHAGYRLSDEFDISVDVHTFNDLCGELHNGQERDLDGRMSLYNKVLEVYRGDFTCPGDTARVLRNTALGTTAQFLETMAECCDMLWNNEMYRQILDLHQRVSRVRRPCDELTVYRFRAMSMLGMHRGVASAWYKTEAEFEEHMEADSPVLKEIREIVRNAMLFIEQKDKAVASITRELSRELLEAGAGDKAVVCSYDELKHLCRKYPGRYTMAVFTFRLPCNEAEACDVEQAMQRFQEIASRSLRGHDMVAPYSDNQLVVMMPNHSVTSGHLVKERLCSSFREEMGGNSIYLEADISELRPAAMSG